MTSSRGQPKTSWTNAISIAFLASLPILIVARRAGASDDVLAAILFGVTAALSPIVFMILRVRNRRKWMKKWQGPAHMYRVVPAAPMQAAGGFAIEDRGYLQGLIRGYKYIFADDPSGLLMRDFALLGTWAGIMEFLDQHAQQTIENRSQIPGAGIYMSVEPYEPIERYKYSRGVSYAVVKHLLESLSSFIPGRHPVVDLAENIGELNQTLKPLLEHDEDRGNQKPAYPPWTVLIVTFSLLEGDKGSHLIGEHSVDFGTVRRILDHAD